MTNRLIKFDCVFVPIEDVPLKSGTVQFLGDQNNLNDQVYLRPKMTNFSQLNPKSHSNLSSSVILANIEV